MAEKFIVHTAALIYNDRDQLLLAQRSLTEKTLAGVYSYPGGKLEYDIADINQNFDSIIDALEKNLKREVMEEVNLEIDALKYIHSHTFVKKSGDKAVVIVFLAKQTGGNAKADGKEIASVKWVDKDSFETVDTLPIIKKVYALGFDYLMDQRNHSHIDVAGIVINDNHEFLVLKESSTGKYIFPKGPVENLPGRTWEILEKNLTRHIFTQTAIEIADGMIPFTDREFLGRDGFEKIVQFFICKYNRGEAIVTDPFRYSEVKWMKITDMKAEDFQPLILTVYQKALEFITKINN